MRTEAPSLADARLARRAVLRLGQKGRLGRIGSIRAGRQGPASAGRGPRKRPTARPKAWATRRSANPGQPCGPFSRPSTDPSRLLCLWRTRSSVPGCHRHRGLLRLRRPQDTRRSVATWNAALWSFRPSRTRTWWAASARRPDRSVARATTPGTCPRRGCYRPLRKAGGTACRTRTDAPFCLTRTRTVRGCSGPGGHVEV
jgi:hypothetical protein